MVTVQHKEHNATIPAGMSGHLIPTVNHLQAQKVFKNSVCSLCMNQIKWGMSTAQLLNGGDPLKKVVTKNSVLKELIIFKHLCGISTILNFFETKHSQADPLKEIGQ